MISKKEFDRSVKAKLLKLTESYADDINKELWDNSEKEVKEENEVPEKAEQDFNMEIDGEKYLPEDDMTAMEFISQPKEIEENEITDQMENQFKNLSNEEKKELLFKLVKNDMDIDGILKEYLDDKCPCDDEVIEGCRK